MPADEQGPEREISRQQRESEEDEDGGDLRVRGRAMRILRDDETVCSGSDCFTLWGESHLSRNCSECGLNLKHRVCALLPNQYL